MTGMTAGCYGYDSHLDRSAVPGRDVGRVDRAGGVALRPFRWELPPRIRGRRSHPIRQPVPAAIAPAGILQNAAELPISPDRWEADPLTTGRPPTRDRSGTLPRLPLTAPVGRWVTIQRTDGLTRQRTPQQRNLPPWRCRCGPTTTPPPAALPRVRRRPDVAARQAATDPVPVRRRPAPGAGACASAPTPTPACRRAPVVGPMTWRY